MADQMWNRHNCIKEAFSVLSTNGGVKMRQRSTLLRHKFLDPYRGYSEDMSTQSDCSLNFINNIHCRRVNRWQTHKITEVVALEDIFPSEDQEFLHTSSNCISPATETHGDVSMETVIDFKMPGDTISKEKRDFPTRLVMPFELPRNSEVSADAIWPTPDYSLLMDIDPSKSRGFLESPVTAAPQQPMLTECEGDVTMCEQPITKSKQVFPILECVGEKLREKLHVDLN
ncbi:hypothetical protein G0U57_004969 [Chelydra serpentina]|uniref:Uncharacterized protein n=1 Tax=Chelydra serpentina TaxID=8475 RepID=A0A8T1SKT7_CHESE|nr:hypothetical protein G0U57_004969 [Chelydra serpentina]